MFLVFIDELISDLYKQPSGPIIESEHIPVTLLADDTTLMSPTLNGIQSQLDTVYLYSCKWRLTYNLSKSGGPKPDNSVTPKLGEEPLCVKKDTVYAGSWITSENISERTHRACAKARRTISSFKDIGLRAGEINPIGCANIWRRVILPCTFYACEL
jgi:hypothetical protein